MADETKKVEYEYTGDVSSLASATKKAISFLNQYESTVKDLTKSGQFNVSKTAFSSFNKTINGITKQVNSLVSSLNKSFADVQDSLLPDVPKITSASNDIRDALEMLQSSANVTSKDVKFLTDYLKDAQSTFTSVADKAKVLSSSFASLRTIETPKVEKPVDDQVKQAEQSTREAATSTQHSVDSMIEASRRLVQNTLFADYAREVEAANTRVSKSARESARVLTSEKDVQFEDKLNRIRDVSEGTANSIRNSFNSIRNVFSPITSVSQQLVSKLQAMKDKSSEVLDHLKFMLEAAGSGFRQFRGEAEAAGDAGLTAAAGAAAAADGAAAIDPKVAIATKALQALKKVLEGLSKICKSVARAGFEVLKKAITSLKSKMDSSSGSMQGFARLLGGAGIGAALAEATKSAISYIENLNLFTVAMGESIDEASAFIDKMSELYGMDPSNLYRYSGYFYQLSDAIGTTSKASKVMSLSLTKAANDISSLFNQKIEDVVNNLASGMQGMSRAVRKYGIDIRQTTLQQTALNYGFTENISTTSEANRQALRYLTIMQQVRNATKQVTNTVDGSTEVMGDFARNIETPANQLRILKEQASQVARSFGNFFIPIMQKTLYVINGVLMAIKTLLQFLAALAGIDISSFGGDVSSRAEDAAGAVGGIGDAADKTAKKLKNLIAPFDELTILTEPKDTDDSGLGGIGSDLLDPNLAAAIEAMELGLDEIRMKALDVRDKILELLGLSWDDGDIVVTIGGFIDDLIHLWDSADYTGFGKRIAEFLNQGIAWGIEHTNPAKYAPVLNQKVRILSEVLNGLVAGLNWGGLGIIIGNGITLALGMLNTFLETFDFKALGSALGMGLMGIVNAVDWDLLGTTIGNYFKSKIEFGLGFIDSIEWPTIGTKLAVGLNSIVATVPWGELGQLLAGYVTSFFGIIGGFVDNFDFVALGASLGTGVMTMLNSVNWVERGNTLGRLFNGVIDTIRTYLETYEWGTIGSTLAQSINGIIREINWHNFGATVSDTLRGLLREVTNFLGELDWFSIGKAIMEFILAIDWLGLLTDVVVAVITILGAVVRGLLGMIVGIFTGIGADIAEGFQNGILDGLRNIGSWLWDHLCDPVIRSVKGFFGIHSPSTVFAEIGGYIVQGLFNGITNMSSTAATWVKEHLCDPIINGAKTAFGISGGVASTFKDIGGQLLSGLFSGLGNIGTKVADWGNNIIAKVKGVFDIHSPSKEFEEIGNYMNAGLFKGIEDTKQIQKTYSDMLQTMQATTKTFTDNATKSFKEMTDANTNTLNNLKNTHQTVTNSIVSMYGTMASNSITKIQSIITSLNSIPRNISTTHTITTNNVVNSAANNARMMATGGVVRGPTNAIIGEGRYDEAVIPLGNSPEIEEMIDKIAAAVSTAPKGSSDRIPPIEVHVYLDGSEITSSQNRTNRMFGRTQQKI